MQNFILSDKNISLRKDTNELFGRLEININTRKF